MKTLSTLFILLLICNLLSAREKCLSPNSRIKLNIELVNNRFFYSIDFDNQNLIKPSGLGLKMHDREKLTEFNSISYEYLSFDETWTPVWGQFSKIRNQHNEILVNLSNDEDELHIRFRVFNDAVAFRYEYPSDADFIKIVSEETYFEFADNFDCWWIWADYNTLEKLYYNTKLDSASHVAAPFTLKTDNDIYLSILEASIDNYSSMTLIKTGKYTFKVNLVPWSDGFLVKTPAPFVSPWRVIQIAPNPGGLLESQVIYNLNDPPEENDYSWIKPIKFIGIWWEMHLGISEWSLKNNRHGATTENAKRYIDFAAKNGIDAVLIEGWNTGWEDWGKPGCFDFITPYPDFDIFDVVNYARQRNIEIIGHHETGGDILAYEESVDRAFEFYNQLGIKYVKTGYAGPVNPPEEHHHGQYMLTHFNNIMRKAMEYKIILNVHESVIPSGLSRTYPNLMTFEAVRGIEWDAWSEGNPPSHTCVLPFTRGLAGPMDYTPGIFNINHDKFVDLRTPWNSLDVGKSRTHSTIVNQIALLIILYSPMQMAADLIENYKEIQAFEFLKMIPATWDYTKVLSAEIGKFVIIARKYQNNWFVAGITNENSREVNINTDFLDDNLEYYYKIIQDSDNTCYLDNPENYTINKGNINAKSNLRIRLAKGGGFVMIISENVN